MDDLRWVVLIHEDYEKQVIDYLKNGDGLLAIWHIEPITRYQRCPPGNPKWLLHKIVSGSDEAFDYICDSGGGRKVIQDVYDRFDRCDGSLSSRYKIMKRDNFHCCLCGRGAEDGVKLEVDHKTPRSLGGPDTADNLWTLCFDCNRGKSNRDVNA